jgi:hypothetical protein
MKCSEARHLVHLEAGNDLHPEEQLTLSMHLGECPKCKNYRTGMARSTKALLSLLCPDAAPHATSSAWPAISRAIQQRSSTTFIVRKFNLQVAALSVCSLCLAAVTIVQTLSAMRSGDDSDYGLPALAQPAGFSTGAPAFKGLARPAARRAPNGIDLRESQLPIHPEAESF